MSIDGGDRDRAAGPWAAPGRCGGPHGSAAHRHHAANKRVGPTREPSTQPHRPEGGSARDRHPHGPTAAAGSGRRSRLGPGPQGRALPEVRGSTTWSGQCPAFRVANHIDNPCPEFGDSGRKGRSPRGRERAGCEEGGGSRAGPSRCHQPWPSRPFPISAYDRLRRVKGARPVEPGALPALDPASARLKRRRK